MEPYKRFLMIGVGLMFFSALVACTLNIPFISILPLIAGIFYLAKGIKMGKNELFVAPEVQLQIEMENEKSSKARVVMETIGCMEDEARRFLDEYDWDDVKIYMEFKSNPEKFYNRIRGGGAFVPAAPSITPSIPVASNEKRCSQCSNIYSSYLQYCPSCEAGLNGFSKPTQSLQDRQMGEKKCSSCGTLVPLHLAYCTECGYKF